MGFADCKEVAITVSGNIPNSEVCYGMFTPLTDPNTWDQRWNIPNSDHTYTHFWVEKDGKIIDKATSQFGGPEEVITSVTDKRYVKVGKLIPETDKHIQISVSPSIDWGTCSGPGGKVTVNWPNYEKYIRDLKGL